MAIVPSHRVAAEHFIGLLRNNGLSPRVIGSGSGRVVDAEGRKVCVRGVFVIAVPLVESARTRSLARLCGITAVDSSIQDL